MAAARQPFFLVLCTVRIHSYLQSAAGVLQEYKGDQPFATWLKAYFSANKKFGSRDRKQVSHLCYSYFRLGHAFKDSSIEERILTALFLASDAASPYLQELRPDWNERVGASLKEKLAYLGAENEWAHIFPWGAELSGQIEAYPFAISFLQQPHLYLRLRPGKEKPVLRKLEAAGITSVRKDARCLQLPNSTRIEDIILIDEEAVVQDYSSQKVLDPIHDAISDQDRNPSVWDCCAASGGKSLLAHDLFGGIELTVSDIRQSILHNLQARFRRAGLVGYKSFVADVSSPKFSTNNKYDIVICDAPCSGAGTWSRTPEQLFFFTEEKINYYADLQKKIATNAVRAVKKSGYFVYITCSVFRKENEEVAEQLAQKKGLQLQSQHYFKGYADRADTLYMALFRAL
jgi:16S rRNA (cytosine967-C5)-methyltransferase